MNKIILLTFTLCTLFFNKTLKSQDVVINEIMYNFGFNLDKLESGNWIELYNTTNSNINLAGWKIQFGANTYTIVNASIPANGYLVATSKYDLMAANYPGVPLLGESLGFGLDDATETIKVINRDNVLVDEVTYSDAVPWPDCADGNGQSLSLISVTADNSLANSWSCSGNLGGTPGADNINNCTAALADIIINELNYKSLTTVDAGDWVELYNAGNLDVDISGWYMLDSDTLYIIPQGTTIAADGYLVITSELVKFANIHNTVPLANLLGSSLMPFSGDGEQIALITNNRCLVDELNYNDSAPWPEKPDGLGATLSLIDPTYNNKVAGSWTSSSVSGAVYGTPNQPNDIPDPCATAPPDLVINEVNYDSDGDNNPSNWLEIYNPNGTEVNLAGFKINNKGEQYTIPSGTTIGAMEYLVFTDSINKFIFTMECPPDNAHPFDTELNFSNGGDLVSIYSFFTNDHGCLIDSVRYNNKAPWPINVGGSGNTIELINVGLDNSDPANWAASNFYLGSAGIVNQQATPTICPCDAVDIVRTGNLFIPNLTLFKAEKTVTFNTASYTLSQANSCKITAGECVTINQINVIDTLSNFFIEIKDCQ